MKVLPLARFVSISLSLGFFAPSLHAEEKPPSKKACITASTNGQVSRDEGKLTEAREYFLACVHDACPAVVRKSCAKWLAETEDVIPSVVVRVLDASGADVTDVTLTIDGEESPVDGRSVPLNPGRHTFAVETESGVRQEEEFLLAEGEQSRLLTFKLPGGEESGEAELAGAGSATPTDTSEFTIPTGAWVLGGAGVLALGSFTYFGLSADSELATLQDTCSPGCTDAQTKSGRDQALIADISLGVGIAAIVGAVTWTLLSQPDEGERQQATLIDVQPLAGGAFASFTTAY